MYLWQRFNVNGWNYKEVRWKRGEELKADIGKNTVKLNFIQAVKGVKEVKIPVQPSSRLGFEQAAPGEVSFRPGQPKRPAQKLPTETGQTTKILQKDSLSTKYNKLGDASSAIKEADKTLVVGELNRTKSGIFSSFKKSMENVWTNVREFIQDDWYRVKKLVENKNWKMEGLDPYQREILFKGRVGTRLEEVKNVVINIDKDIIYTSKRIGIKDNELIDEVNSYLISKHAPERNLKLGEMAVGISTKDANETIRILEESAHFDEIKRVANQISDLNKNTLDVLLEGQVIDKELYNMLRTTYKNHIPLNRVFEENEDIIDVLVNKGLDVKWSGLRRAVGSERKVDCLAHHSIFSCWENRRCSKMCDNGCQKTRRLGLSFRYY